MIGNGSRIGYRARDERMPDRSAARASGSRRPRPVTVKTVEYHVTQIFTRLGIDVRTEIAALFASMSVSSSLHTGLLTRGKRRVTIMKPVVLAAVTGRCVASRLLRVQEVDDDRAWQREQFRCIAGALGTGRAGGAGRCGSLPLSRRVSPWPSRR